MSVEFTSTGELHCFTTVYYERIMRDTIDGEIVKAIEKAVQDELAKSPEFQEVIRKKALAKIMAFVERKEP